MSPKCPVSAVALSGVAIAVAISASGCLPSRLSPTAGVPEGVGGLAMVVKLPQARSLVSEVALQSIRVTVSPSNEQIPAVTKDFPVGSLTGPQTLELTGVPAGDCAVAIDAIGNLEAGGKELSVSAYRFASSPMAYLIKSGQTNSIGSVLLKPTPCKGLRIFAQAPPAALRGTADIGSGYTEVYVAPGSRSAAAYAVQLPPSTTGLTLAYYGAGASLLGQSKAVVELVPDTLVTVFVTDTVDGSFRYTVSLDGGSVLEDPTLELLACEATGAAAGHLTEADLAVPTSLNAADTLVRSLKGLEHATNLKTLSLARTIVTDLSPLLAMPALTQVDLTGVGALIDAWGEPRRVVNALKARGCTVIE